MRTIYHCFPGGRHKALTMSYDDGTVADRRLVDIFNRCGIKGTFHLNSGLMGSGNRIPREEIKSLYAGHEVSVHTVSHPTIARSPIDQVASQVLEDRRDLERLVGYPVRGMSYPNGSHNPAIRKMLPHLGIEYARVVETTHGFDMPEDLHQWKGTCHHSQDLLATGRRFIDMKKSQLLSLLYVWGHSYEFDNDGNWGLIEELCRMVGGTEGIWFATNIQIVDCMKAWGNLRLSVDGDTVVNPNAASVWIEVDGAKVEIKGGAQVSLA